MIGAVHAARLLFGAWMVLGGVNYFLGPFVPMPAGSNPSSAQLLAAFEHSGLLGVAMAMELAGGALLLAGVWVPFALAALMPVSTCALYWSALDGEPLWILPALAAFALNGLLMLAHLDAYRDVLRDDALAAGEAAGADYDKLFVNPLGDAPRGAYPGAFAALAAALAFYHWIVPGVGGFFGLIVLIFPTAMLLAGWARALARRV